MQYKKFVLCLVIPVMIISCSDKESHSWFTYLDNIGTYSSPRLVDLNKDNIPDIVIGAGGKEEHHCDSAVLALDGVSGKILWSIPGDNQYVGSAVFKDITNDEVPDVFIGGRWALLSAINGATGKVIWSFFPDRKRPDGQDGGWYNFTTPQFIPDQDGDHIDDIIIANGGDARAAPGNPERPVGRILVLSSSTGKILANVAVPDGRETYMSVVCYEGSDKNLNVLFGTGGETISGHLYRTTLQDIMKGDLSHATVIASSVTKGFVAAPVVVDINRDGIKDIVSNTAEGKMLAINGATDSLLWEVNFIGTEAYTMPAVGFFNKDSVPDFFANFAIGVFPTLNYSIRFMVDGKTGKIGYQDTIPAFQYASGVAADWNGDGIDEVILNQSAMERKQFQNNYYSYLVALDFKNHKKILLGKGKIPAVNLASTLWVGDMDDDNNFDLIYCAVKYPDALFDLQEPMGLYIGRLRTDVKITRPVTWGAFMGSNYTSVIAR